jgi:predicted metal-dependent phosphoesterase TrpH
VTDHDTVDGVDAAVAAGTNHEVTVLAGVELSVTLDGDELHLLAYAVDPTHDDLLRHLHRMQEARRQRVWKMVDRLREHGLAIEEAALQEEIEETAAAGRPHVAAALVRGGHVESLREAFDRHLGPDGPAFVAKPAFPAGDALNVIHEAGGVGVLAHPGHWTSSGQIRQLVDAGLDGIEVYHPSHDSSLRGYYRRIAGGYDLLTTGGSDYHGHETDEAVPLGGIGLNARGWERFRAALT